MNRPNNLRRISLHFGVVFWFGLLASAYAQLPNSIKPQVAPSSYSVSARGDVFAILLQEDGASFVSTPNRNFELPAPNFEDYPGGNPKIRSSVVVNPDGKYILHFLRGQLFIRNLPEAKLVWVGSPDLNHVSSAHAYHYRAADNRLLVVRDNNLYNCDLGSSSPATCKGVSPISFPENGREPSSGVLDTAVFTEDGRTLYLGTRGGEVLAVDTSEQEPRLRWRSPVFERFKAPSFDDESTRYVSGLSCADACK